MIAADVSTPTRARRSSHDSVAALGGIDGIVLNVGIGAGVGLTGTTVEDWDLVANVNVRAHFLVCQAAKEHLGEGSSIVFISSVAGLNPAAASRCTTRPRRRCSA